ncbi:ABC transporter ATP-binding protein [Pseudonocardia xishanensis]|uniref:ABC transporter ATP-binding protein n=1 Tax=Pseudonocardia xishanensis TaxID=630995 RepID=A0ABP8RS12_9PSEU
MAVTVEHRPRSGFGVLVDAYRLRGRAVLAGWVFGVGWQGVQVLAPLVIAAAVDHGILGRDPWRLGLWSAVLVGLCVVEMTLTALRHRFAIIPAVEVSLRLREDLLRRVHRADPGTRRRAPGDVVSRATSDVEAVTGLIDFTPSTVACLTSTAAVTVALSVIDPLLAAAVLLPLLPVGVVFWWWSRRLEAVTETQQRSTAALATSAEAELSQIRAVHGLNAAGPLHLRWDAVVETARRNGLRVGRLRALLLPVVELLRVAAVVLVLLVGAGLLTAGALSVGELLAAVTYVIYLGPLLSQIGVFLAQARGTLASAARLASAVPPPRPRTAAPSLPSAGPAGRHLRVSGVTGNGLRPVDLDVRPGEVVAALGGVDDDLAGLAEILAGRRVPVGGRVLLDGTDVTGKPSDEVVVVERSSFLFSGTVRESVVFARPDAPAGDLAVALARSGAAEVVDSLADGLQTGLPAGATSLSGGQRQRLALARALLADPTVLICVDATAAVDPATATAVLAGLRDRGRTTLVLTTDPSTAELADRAVDLRAIGRAEEMTW